MLLCVSEHGGAEHYCKAGVMGRKRCRVSIILANVGTTEAVTSQHRRNLLTSRSKVMMARQEIRFTPLQVHLTTHIADC